MLRITGILLITSTIGVSTQSQESFCGEKAPNDAKTCISVRLPWQEAPIYFCTEKANIPFKDRCTEHLARYCPTETSNSTLLVATPWDCCALTSTPDFCQDRTCPSTPFNRTCHEIAPDARRPWECCPTHFCEQGEISNCQMKRIQPECNSPPKGKTNCIAFKDDHGCCNKFQCKNEGKPGMCPMEVQAIKFKRMMDSTSSTSASGLLSRNFTNADSDMNSTNTAMGFPARKYGSPIVTELKCVGDFNCPGQMKCCSPLMSTYYAEGRNTNTNTGFDYLGLGNGRDKAVYGYCVEPVSNEN